VSDWKIIPQQRGRRQKAEFGSPTMAYRKVGARSGLALCFNISKIVVEQMGWEGMQRVDLSRNEMLNQFRITPTESGGRALNKKGGTRILELSYDLSCGPKPAQSVKHEVVGNSLVIHGPPWTDLPHFAAARAARALALKNAGA
jgi:hypothetical protein